LQSAAGRVQIKLISSLVHVTRMSSLNTSFVCRLWKLFLSYPSNNVSNGKRCELLRYECGLFGSNEEPCEPSCRDPTASCYASCAGMAYYVTCGACCCNNGTCTVCLAGRFKYYRGGEFFLSLNRSHSLLVVSVVIVGYVLFILKFCVPPSPLVCKVGGESAEAHLIWERIGQFQVFAENPCFQNLAPTGIRFPDRPARSESLYRLRQHAPRVCVCSLSYPGRKAHAPYYIVICGLSGSTMFFPHYLINGAIFGKKLLNIKCVFWFSVQLLFENSLFLRRIELDRMIKMYIGVRVLERF
jgi:hypothetical protein